MAGIPQVITEDRASGAQFIDGSLKFDSSKSQYLKRKPTADGNGKLWTWSGWLKRTPGALHDIFSAGQEVTNDGLYSRFRIDSDDCLNYRQWVNNSSLDAYLVSSMKLRDPSAYFHYVAIYDSNNSTNSDKVRFYINGQRVTVFSSNDYPGGTNSSWVNSSSKTHTIGGHYDGGTSADSFFNGHMSQVYFLDGIAAGPEEFGYTDPLTGTWRPKKFDSFNNPNNGTTWSNLTTASSGSFEGSLPKTNLFDGIASNANRANLDTVGASIDIDFSSNPITVKNTISIWSGKANLSYSINGGAYVNYSDAAEAYKDIPFTGTLTSLSLTKSDEGAGASAIKIDGYILIDGAPNNSFYLPLDGNTPIGKDQSGNGNDWTPVNFGGSVELPRATGAIPILNTNEAGTVAKPGARTDSKTYTVTASGGKYYLDGVLTPTLNFLRGGTYIFDYTGATSHPFKFSTTADGTHGGGSEYTDGTNTATSNVMKITVPHNAPDTLYYYCSAHSGMGSSINVTTDILKADPYAWKCVLVQPLISTQSDVSDQINCNSIEKVITASGATASIVSRNFYGGSTYFDGNDSITTPDNNDYDFGTGEFTVEIWVRPNSISGDQYIVSWEGGNADASHNGINIYNGNWRIGGFNNALIGGNNGLVANKWTHIAMSRDSNKLRVFVNGVRIGTSSTGAGLNFDCSSNFTLGKYAGNANLNFTGYMSDLRVYKGVAKYTENFVVGSTAPDVLPDTPSGIVGKSKLTKITDGAVTGFESNSDYLTVAASSDFEFTGDHTIEMFIYHNTLAGDSVPFATGGSGSPDQLYISTTGEFYYAYGQTGAINAPAGTIVVGRWQHIAVSKQGTYLRMFVDGKMVAASPNHSSTIGSSSAVPYIGMRGDGSHPVEGFISNLRIVKGTALYTSEFTPPTEPLTEVTNTKLLCCQSTTSAVSAAVAPGTFVNDGTNYSSGNQVTGSAGLRDVDSIFDGHLKKSGNPSQNEAATVNISSDNYILWTPTTGIPYTSKVEVYCYAANGYEITNYYTFNGGTETTFTGGGSNFNGNNWITVATGSGTINSIKIRITRGSGNQSQVNWYAVRVDGTVLINDYSGKSLAKTGNAEATNFNPFTDDINAIRGQVSGYATLNPIFGVGRQNQLTYSDGNLTVRSAATSGNDTTAVSTLAVKGKIYCEFALTEDGVGAYVGVMKSNTNLTSNGIDTTASSDCWLIRGDNGNKANGDGGSGASYGSAFATGDLIMMAVDIDNTSIWWGKNGVWFASGNPATGSNAAYTNLPSADDLLVMCGDNYSSETPTIGVNFGQKPFKFPPPDGFQPLNLSTVQPEKVIARPDQYVDAITYSGNSTSSNIITDLNFNSKPDFVWIKSRSGSSSPGSQNHYLVDSVRGANGASGTSKLYSNNNLAANSGQTATTNGVRFAHNGFELTTNNDGTNSNNNYVAWCWKAGGDKNTFNIDDVGYANASDVNMNAGTLNSSLYNDSEVWRTTGTLSVDLNGSTVTNMTGPLSKAFEGSLASSSMVYEGTAYTSGTKTYTYTFGTAQTNITSARVYLYQGNSAEGGATGFGNGTINKTQDGTYGWVDASSTIPANGTVTAMTMTTTATSGVNSSRNGFIAIELNGKMLLDNGVTPTDNFPSIVPTRCSVGTKQGFSIITYSVSSDSTVAHGLTQAPEFGIFKCTTEDNSNWGVYYTVNGNNTNWMALNNTDAQGSGVDYLKFYDKYVQIASNSFAGQGDAGVGYMWHSVPGLQKFGTYEGIGGTADGAFVELGFRPAIVWVKNIDTASQSNTHWCVFDNTRPGYNKSPAQNRLHLDETVAEDPDRVNEGQGIDILSNGFRVRSNNWYETNLSGATYIYCAWAEAPSINLYGAQSNAR